MPDSAISSSSAFKYDAFISYRRSDGSRVAHQLRNHLRYYRLPEALSGGGPHRKLSIYLDTIYERATEDFFETTIKPALQQSRHLIVVRTPDSLKPRADSSINWTEREIAYFRTLPHGNHISIAFAAGEFDDLLPAGLDQDLANIEKVDIRRRGRFRGRDWGAQIVKFIAALYEIPQERMPELQQEEERRRAARLRRVAALSILISLALAGLLGWALQSRASLKKALSQADYQQASILSEKGEDAQSLAYVAESLRLDPENLEAQSLLLAQLLRKSWPLPVSELPAGENSELSADGRFILTEEHGSVRIRNAASLEPIGRPIRIGEDSRIVSTSLNALRVATFGDSGLTVWNVELGLPVRIRASARQPLQWAALSPDGAHLILASEKALTFRNLATDREWKLTTKSLASRAGLRFSGDARRMALQQWEPGDRPVVRIFELPAGGIIGEPIAVPGILASIELSPDGETLLTVSLKGDVQLWSVRTGRLVSLLTTVGKVYTASFDPTGREILALLEEGAQLWRLDQEGASPLARIGSSERFVSAGFRHDGQVLLTLSRDNEACLWDIKTGERIAEPIPDIRSARFVGHSSQLATISSEGTFRVWRIEPVPPRVNVLRARDRFVAAHFSTQARQVVVAEPTTLGLYNPDAGQHIGTSVQISEEALFSSVRLSYEGRFAAAITLHPAHLLRTWDLQSGQEVGTPLPGPSSDTIGFGGSSYGYDPEARIVTALTKNESAAVLWRVDSSAGGSRLIQHRPVITSLTLSPAGGRVLTTGLDRAVRVWDTRSGRLQKEISLLAGRTAAAEFSPDGQRIAVGSSLGVVSFWKADSGKLLAVSPTLRSPVKSIHFNRTGSLLLVQTVDAVTILESGTALPVGATIPQFGLSSAEISADDRRVLIYPRFGETAGLWDIQTGHQLGTLIDTEEAIFDARFSPDGQRLWIASKYHLSTWDVPILPSHDTEPLVLLAKAVAGFEVDAVGGLVSLQDRVSLLNELRRETAQTPLGKANGPSLIHWFLADRWTRTVSPLSPITVREFIRSRLDEGTPEARDEAMRAFPGHPLFVRLVPTPVPAPAVSGPP